MHAALLPEHYVSFYTNFPAGSSRRSIQVSLVGFNPVLSERPVPVLLDRAADLLHQMIVEIKIVKNQESHPEHLLCLEQMVDVRPGVASARRAAASFLERRLVKREPCVV